MLFPFLKLVCILPSFLLISSTSNLVVTLMKHKPIKIPRLCFFWVLTDHSSTRKLSLLSSSNGEAIMRLQAETKKRVVVPGRRWEAFEVHYRAWTWMLELRPQASRSWKVRKELQVEVDQLLETRLEENQILKPGREPRNPTPVSSRQQVVSNCSTVTRKNGQWDKESMELFH